MTETVVVQLDDLPESEAQWSATKAPKRIRGAVLVRDLTFALLAQLSFRFMAAADLRRFARRSIRVPHEVWQAQFGPDVGSFACSGRAARVDLHITPPSARALFAASLQAERLRHVASAANRARKAVSAHAGDDRWRFRPPAAPNARFREGFPAALPNSATDAPRGDGRALPRRGGPSRATRA